MEFKRQNRYNEVLPFNHTRVILKGRTAKVAESEETIKLNLEDSSTMMTESESYMNANFISVRDLTFFIDI